jgi:hypothetical protein
MLLLGLNVLIDERRTMKNLKKKWKYSFHGDELQQVIVSK